MFDLIDECGKDLRQYGYKITRHKKYSISTATLIVDSRKKSQNLEMPLGEYYIVNSPFLYDYGMDCFYVVCEFLTKKFQFLPKISIRCRL